MLEKRHIWARALSPSTGLQQLTIVIIVRMSTISYHWKSVLIFFVHVYFFFLLHPSKYVKSTENIRISARCAIAHNPRRSVSVYLFNIFLFYLLLLLLIFFSLCLRCVCTVMNFRQWFSFSFFSVFVYAKWRQHFSCFLSNTIPFFRQFFVWPWAYGFWLRPGNTRKIHLNFNKFALQNVIIK